MPKNNSDLQQSSSPIKSFVDLATGSFGAVMLLSLALVHSASKSQGASVSGRAAVSISTGLVNDAALNEMILCSLECDGERLLDRVKLRDCSDTRMRSPDGKVACTVRRGFQCLLLDVEALGIQSPKRVSCSLSWDIGRSGENQSRQLWPSTVSLMGGGTAISSAVVSRLRNDSIISVKGVPTGATIRVELMMDPSIRELDHLLTAEFRE